MPKVTGRDHLMDIVKDARELVENLFASPGWKTVGALLLVGLQFLFGDIEPAHRATVTLIAADWIFGISYALLTRQLSSSRGLRGVIKMGLYAGIFVVAHQVETVQIAGVVLKGGLFGVIVVTEAISVLEKIDLIGRHLRIDLWFLRPVITRLRQSQHMEGRIGHE